MFDLAGVQCAVALQGLVARIVVAEVAGSAPREVGAAMLVWAGGQSGTIGGGALEHAAVARAREMLEQGGVAQLDRLALGPGVGQCCGGAVAVLTEVYGAADLARLSGEVIARPLADAPMPLAVKRILAKARGQGVLPHAQFVQGWMVEPVARPLRHVWIWGAGHVGRALVSVLAPLPDLAITWVDVTQDRFPDVVPDGVRCLPVANPVDAVRLAPVKAEHVILTYSHALDLALCHALLVHGFARCGLIGSATKWARFRSRLRALGHQAAIERIDCPIGQPSLGKHPHAIAIGVAAVFLAPIARARQEIVL